MRPEIKAVLVGAAATALVIQTIRVRFYHKELKSLTETFDEYLNMTKPLVDAAEKALVHAIFNDIVEDL